MDNVKKWVKDIIGCLKSAIIEHFVHPDRGDGTEAPQEIQQTDRAWVCLDDVCKVECSRLCILEKVDALELVNWEELIS